MTFRFIVALTLVAQLGCGSQAPISTESGKPDVPAIPVSTPRNAKIPAEVSYPVIRDEEEYNAFTKKRMVDVKLNMRISSNVLREIALEIKAAEKHQYERTFIFFYLPERVSGARNAPWATCHFDPTLDVTILGSTIESENALRKLPVKHPGKRIGCWFREGLGIEVIYEDAGVIKDGTITGGVRYDDLEMVELPSQDGRRFQLKGSDEVYHVDSSGVLRMYNRDGKVFDAAIPLK